ncbi:hypothetical protein ABBQ32_004719 [Trebouxia sp. C0010 RCD-2024]
MVSVVEVFRHALNRKSTPARAPERVSKVILLQGILYMLIGAFVYIAPSTFAVLAQSFRSADNELVGGASRNAGLQTAFVGWFYVVGALSHSASVIAATIVGHAFVLPPLLMLAGLAGNLELGIAVTLATTDFAFGNMAWYMYSQDLSRIGPKIQDRNKS